MKLTGLLLRTGFIISLFPGSGGGYYQVLMSVPRAKVYRLYSVVFCKQCLSHLASFSTSGKTEGSFTTFYLNSFQLENIDMGLAATHYSQRNGLGAFLKVAA